MKFIKNLKHIFSVSILTVLLIFFLGLFAKNELFIPMRHFFIYRDAPFQNALYKYSFVPNKDIVIVKIDDETLNTLQSQSNLKVLTLSKKTYIDIINNLEWIGVKAIGFDIVFQNKDPDEFSFAETLSQFSNIVIATESPEKKNFLCIKDEDSTEETCPNIPRSVYKNAQWWHAGIIDAGDRRANYIYLPESIEWKTEKIVPNFPLAIVNAFSSGSITQDILSQSGMLNTFFWKNGVYPYISFSDVLSMSKVELISNFKDKIVLIGESGTLIHDMNISPVTGKMMAWVEFHAHTIDSILQWKILKEYGFNTPLFLAIIALIVVFSVTVYFSIPSFVAPFLAIIWGLLCIMASRYLYGEMSIMVDIFPLLLATSLFSYPITFLYKYFIVDRERHKIQSAFAHYIDPLVVQTIADSGTPVELWGEKKNVTVLFSDIAGFTTISEKIGTKELFLLMSSYLSVMTEILIKNRWTLDKYIGDAIMGFFWAPLSFEDHPIRGCITALEMRERLPAFNLQIEKMWIEPIDFRVGLATGEVMIGNIGSSDRFNYTALGDTVNLASRLEWAGKEYHTHITVSEAVYLATKDLFLFRRLDKLRVKGKTEPIMIYELLGRIIASDSVQPDKITSKLAPQYEIYEWALELYFSGKYLEAGKIFEANTLLDPTSGMMAERCLSLLKDKRILEDGVWDMKKK
jgi:class 3 adenylate cyclase/CHASE2 domain-containing sensor protein